MRTPVVGFQLKTLAALLQKIYAAVDLSQIARAVVIHVRDSVPPGHREPKELLGLERRLTFALEDMYLAGLTPADAGDEGFGEMAGRISAAESYFNDQLESAARMIERDTDGKDGDVLRAASTAIAEAAQDVVERHSNDFALEVARDLEGLGAPPSLLFKLDGRIVWSNHSLKTMLEARGVDKARLTQAACRFAAPLTATLRRREEPTRRRDLRKRINELGVHFSATVKRRGDTVGEALLLVEISEAKRTTQLSEREQQVARLVAEHGSYKNAAQATDISLDSVRTYVRRIYRKLGVSNRMQLKARLIREGLLKSDS